MRQLLILMVIAALGLLLWFLLAQDIDQNPALADTELVVESIERPSEPARLERPERSARRSDLEPEDADESVRANAAPEAVQEAWALELSVTGFTLPLRMPIEVTAVPLGSHDKKFTLETSKAIHSATLSLSDIATLQAFDPPQLQVAVDHPDFFIWDEILEGELTDAGVVFRAEIELEPLTALISGRVVTPFGHDTPVTVAVFAMDKETKAPERDFLVDFECDETGTFSLWVPDVSDAVVVAHARGLVPDSSRISVEPGTERSGILLTLDRGLSVSGWATYQGRAITENQRLFARAPSDDRNWWSCGSEWLSWDGNGQRFYAQSIPAVGGNGTEFVITGLEDLEYTLMFYSSSARSRHFFDPALAQTVRPPATNLKIDFGAD